MSQNQSEIKEEKKCFWCNKPFTSVLEVRSGFNFYLCSLHYHLMKNADAVVQVSKDGRSVIL